MVEGHSSFTLMDDLKCSVTCIHYLLGSWKTKYEREKIVIEPGNTYLLPIRKVFFHLKVEEFIASFDFSYVYK